jgi:hypothetical protein
MISRNSKAHLPKSLGLQLPAAAFWLAMVVVALWGAHRLWAQDPAASISIENSELRTWADPDGKFSVRASLVRIESDKVVLLREDNKEIKVPLATLSPADRQYVDKLRAAKSQPVAPVPPPADKPADNPAEPAAPPPKTLDFLRAESGVPIDASLAIPIDLAGDGTWKYVPEESIVEHAAAPMQVPLSIAVAEHHEAARTLLLPQERKAIVVFQGSRTSKDSESHRSYVCDYDRGRVEVQLDTAGDAPLAISPDGGMLLLAHPESGAQNNTALTVCSRSGANFQRLATWKPYGNLQQGDVIWAAFVDAHQVVTLNSAGDVALWSVPEIWPKWTAKLEQGAAIALSPGRKYLATAAGDGIKLLNVADGKVVGTIEAAIDAADAIAFSDDGKRLAVWSADRIRVWDLEVASLVQDFGLQRTFFGAIRGHGKLDWVDDNHLLVDGRLLVDLDHRVACWEFTNVGSASAVSGGRMWFVDDKTNAPKLCSLALPNPAALNAVSKFTPEQMLVLQPGMRVSVEITNNGGSGDTNAAREALVKKLTDNGIAVVPESQVKFVGEVIPGETQKIRVRMWSASGPSFDEQEHQFTPRTVLLRLIAGGEEVWKRGFTKEPTGYIQLQQNETVDQALQRLTDASVEVLGKYRLPRYLARIPGDNPP